MTRPALAAPQRSRPVAAAAVALAAALLAAPTAAGARATAAWRAAPVPLDPMVVVRQRGEVDCGPALVATLAAWAGRPVPLDEVTARAALGPGGVSLAEFARLADLHGVGGAWYSVPRERLGALRTPFVAHLERGGRGHFVVVVALGSRHAVVADPAAGGVAAPAAELLRHYSGRVFLLDEALVPRWEGV